MTRKLEVFVDAAGRAPFERWFNGLNAPAAARITTALARLEQGNVSGLKSVGQGVHELRIAFGPGYRVYLGLDGPVLVILLGGGTKKGQQTDIEAAKSCWRAYKQRL
ncbi:type II toxin-antitoxin system RelE/ParE family toxin [Thioalkalivibrio sulfidiphilus]|uniref:Addiction module killer protein n=1 Tax=Thioalkalivibrio sulfidiphilus (strain HL-EbGR7) TaxID=396588 RepID=B8GTV8_THISH|nr:type II toxin-antitoxin system RelE/ParE family toxin [Thioalkalivibrio sulfidiphilus]ACL73202.1 addiction module killer protein [Thioalkalivibrio sulfidiphilus HL-EbGr7]